jgi:hypothetical protein
MRKHHVAVALALSFAFLLGAAFANEAAVKSGPQVDEMVPGPFEPLNVTGDQAGKKNCLYCANGTNPVAMVFAREVTPTLTKLIKKIDEETCKNEGCKMGSFVVFLNDKEGLENELKDMAKDANLKKCVLAIDNPSGPKDYNVSKDADVTVVMYTDHTVKANHAFKKGQLKDKDIETVVADVSKIVPK